VSDFPTSLPDEIVARYGHAFDLEERIPRALNALAPMAGRDVLLLDTPSDGLRASQVIARNGRIVASPAAATVPDAAAAPGGAADIVVALWSALDAPGSAAERTATRLVRPGGRILALHDYGRDELQSFIAARAGTHASGTPERREGPFLSGGWKIRVIHCFWTFDDLDEARRFVESFGKRGRSVAATLRRPRLSHNLAIFYRAVSQAS
jgi:hypothetical protein